MYQLTTTSSQNLSLLQAAMWNDSLLDILSCISFEVSHLSKHLWLVLNTYLKSANSSYDATLLFFLLILKFLSLQYFHILVSHNLSNTCIHRNWQKLLWRTRRTQVLTQREVKFLNYFTDKIEDIAFESSCFKSTNNETHGIPSLGYHWAHT